MPRNPRYDVLFEPIQLGPVTAPNRFYQVPHCSGMGFQRPNMLAQMRGIKAEGGWGVVCTEYCSIDPGSDSPYPHASIRDDDDIRNLAAMTDAVHQHGSLAGVELWYGGHTNVNLDTRQVALGVDSLNHGLTIAGQCQSKAMDKADIAAFIDMHRKAAERALLAGFDIVYVYSNHEYLLHNFIDPGMNQRTDEYGGTSRNRVRLLQQVIDAVGEVIDGKAALAVRFSVASDPQRDAEESFECLSHVAELPDLWDITVRDYSLEMGSSRFVEEAAHAGAYKAVKTLTSKPVVGVGRFTSPDTMVAQLRSGCQDLIGAARPSIADPFLPRKIDEGREAEIRECIGCNVCYAHDYLGAPIRCTQNPTMGEEWRRGWHPENIQPAHEDRSILVVGAGPSGLEAAVALGRRGYEVTLVDSEREMGGRINRESRLPGLAAYARVRDWRTTQIELLDNVTFYPSTHLDKASLLSLGYAHVVIATGSEWRSDGLGRWLQHPFAGSDLDGVWSVDRILSGESPEGRVLIYDDDQYYLGSAVALALATRGCEVSMITSDSTVASWTKYTAEHGRIMQSLIEAGVKIMPDCGLQAWEGNSARLECVFTGRTTHVYGDYIVPITSRYPNDHLWSELNEASSEDAGALNSLQRIGDCEAPGTVAAAVYSGHKYAREFASIDHPAARRDRVVIRS